MRASLHAALLVCLLTLSGCGIKGSLYMPDIPEQPDGPPPPGIDHNNPATER